MPRSYPTAWPRIAERVKARAGWRCERCGHRNEQATGHVLTVAHLDHRYGEQRFNLAALCQRCHLKYEHKFQWEQGYFFEHSEWLKPHVAGWRRWLAAKARGVERRERLRWLDVTGGDAMNLSDELIARIAHAAGRYHKKVAAGGDPDTLRAEFKGAVCKWLSAKGVEVGIKFLDIIVAGALGAARVSPSPDSPNTEAK